MLLIVSAALVVPVGTALASSPGIASNVGSSGTTSIRTGGFTPSGDGDVTDEEFPGEEDADSGDEPDIYGGQIVNRSLSEGTGNGSTMTSGKKAKSNPQFKFGFEGLNLYQQRYARGGNQFTVEPPDQGLCVGNGYVVEAVNDVINVFNTSGHSVLPDNTATNIVGGLPRNVNHAVDLNSFYGYRAGGQPDHGHPRPVRDRSELPVRRCDAALLRHGPDPGDGPDDGRVHAREPPRHRRQQLRGPDRARGRSTGWTSPMTGPIRAERIPARTSAITRTSVPTPTASTSRPMPTRGAATASRERRSTPSPRRRWPPVPPT